MYHETYKKGYSVLPQLSRITVDKVFEVTLKDQMQFLEAKREAVKLQTAFAEHDMDDDIYETICRFIVEQYPIRLNEPFTFSNIAMQIQEDIAIHRLSDDRDWLAAAHICFPSGWNPMDKIGRPLSEIHAPIPGMNLSRSRKLVETMVNHGPFERFVWSVVFDDRINFHPRTPKKKFDPSNPCVFIKVERQLVVGFPEHSASLFVMRQHLIRDNIDKPELVKSLLSMTEDQRIYKGINDEFDVLISWLSNS
jgi:hypothetical protein